MVQAFIDSICVSVSFASLSLSKPNIFASFAKKPLKNKVKLQLFKELNELS
jgi:hypothetical protein